MKKTEAGNRVRVTYDLTPSCKRANVGRLYAYKGESLANISCDIRNALCRNIYHDVDMVNAAPTILHQIAVQNGWECPQLTDYVMNRQEYLRAAAEACDDTVGDMKCMMLVLLYGGLVPHGHDAFPKLAAFREEVDLLSSKIAEKYPDVYKIAEAKRAEQSNYDTRHSTMLSKVRSTTMSYVLATFERDCVWAAVQYFQGEGRKVGAIVFDGFLVEQSHKNRTCRSLCCVGQRLP